MNQTVIEKSEVRIVRDGDKVGLIATGTELQMTRAEAQFLGRMLIEVSK